MEIHNYMNFNAISSIAEVIFKCAYRLGFSYAHIKLPQIPTKENGITWSHSL